MQQPGWYAPPGQQQPASGYVDPHAEVMLEPGGFGIRAAAHIIDIVATMVVALISGAIGGILAAIIAAPGWQQHIGKTTPVGYLVALIASLTYHTLAEGLGGATVGKAICGLRVVTERRTPCTMGKSLVRNLAYYLDAMFFGLIGWTSMSKSPMQQRYGDKWAGTIVVHNRSAQSLSLPSPAMGILVSLGAYAIIQVASVVLKTL